MKANSRKSVGAMRVLPSWKPSRNRFITSVISDTRAPQISAKTGIAESDRQKPTSTGTSASRPFSSLRVISA